MRPPFDTEALLEWGDTELESASGRAAYLLIHRTTWRQLVADLMAAAAEIELLTAERTREKAA